MGTGAAGQCVRFGGSGAELLKMPQTGAEIVKKAKGMLPFISKGLEYRDADVMLQLYKTLVRAH